MGSWGGALHAISGTCSAIRLSGTLSANLLLAKVLLKRGDSSVALQPRTIVATLMAEIHDYSNYSIESIVRVT